MKTSRSDAMRCGGVWVCACLGKAWLSRSWTSSQKQGQRAIQIDMASASCLAQASQLTPWMTLWMTAAGDRLSVLQRNATLGRGRDLYRHPGCGTLSPNPGTVTVSVLFRPHARHPERMRTKEETQIIGLAIHPRQTRGSSSSPRWLDTEADQMTSTAMIPRNTRSLPGTPSTIITYVAPQHCSARK